MQMPALSFSHAPVQHLLSLKSTWESWRYMATQTDMVWPLVLDFLKTWTVLCSRWRGVHALVIWAQGKSVLSHHLPSHDPPNTICLTVAFLCLSTPFSLSLTLQNPHSLECPPKVHRLHSWEHPWVIPWEPTRLVRKDWHFSEAVQGAED